MTPRFRTLLPVILLCTGCLGHERDAGATGQPLYSDTPSIRTIAWDCSRDDQTWTLEVTTEHWTANGTLWMAKDTDYLEQHAVRSESAAWDGSSDQLSLELDIVADWREASSGSSTAFGCDSVTHEAINLRLVVYTPGSEEVGDCRSWGSNPSFFDDIEGVEACDLVWEEPDTGA